MKRFDLEERLILFSTLIIEIVKVMPKNKIGNHLSGQLVRSGTSVSLNYGEAQSGESRRDPFMIFKHANVSRSSLSTILIL